ncbi:SIR2 family protein [Desulforhopalus sp. IMCC35007]|uniref:SIR2 family protein n=1 Tax=Desulforhopalus sp. IMCC35007 TaxID=2569543 RepID=UPI0010ADDE03|nr:SIR2 family protein [Desulforhopalus sp. IMCC35007]TKB05861.1 hypothetical protein FCL48_23350 [Desulforhopalus sp. IMCC35007]
MGSITRDDFRKLFKNGEIIFFAGSGISLGSGLHGAPEILQHSLISFLPSIHSDELKLFTNMQPEVVYEILISLSPSTEMALHVWNCLSPDTLSRYGIGIKPNIVHAILARYSDKHGLPIITTNFDTLFEKAADINGIHRSIYMPADIPPEVRPHLGEMTLCKLHGSIMDKGGNISVHGLYTTMTDISKINVPWLEYLASWLKTHHICFMGYSGRDIDIFPMIQSLSISNACRKPIWVNKTFARDPCEKPSERCEAIRLEGEFPSEMLPKITETSALTFYKDSYSSSSSSILQDLSSDLKNRLIFSKELEKFLRVLLYHSTGRYRDAYDLISSFDIEELDQHRGAYLLTYARLSHEISLYDQLEEKAKMVLQWSKGVGDSKVRINSTLQAKCLIAESARMQIPFDTYFEPELASRIPATIVALAKFWIVIIYSRVLLLSKKRAKLLTTGTEHELLEHRIRFLSILTGGALTFKSAFRPFMGMLSNSWLRLKTKCKDAGYASGIGNCNKFVSRFNPELIDKDGYDGIFDLLQSSSGLELTLRNEANCLMAARDYRGAIDLFDEIIERSKDSGNSLNLIKAILGIARCNYESSTTPILTNDQKKLYEDLVKNLDSKTLQLHFLNIKEQYFNC